MFWFDRLDFSDDKMLQGRTFSYSDTQRHRVGTNYLEAQVSTICGSGWLMPRDKPSAIADGTDTLISN